MEGQPTGGVDNSLTVLASSRPSTQPGQSATQLADGRWLLLGGRQKDQAASSSASLFDPKGGGSSVLPAGLAFSRSGHTATLLPDGTVLVLGGTDDHGAVVDIAEQYDPVSSNFKSLGKMGLLARAGHTATVLPDGRILITGGVDSNNATLAIAEIYNSLTKEVEHFSGELNTARYGHVAVLLPSGNVLLWGGLDHAGNALANGEIYDAANGAFSVVDAAQAQQALLPMLNADAPALLRSIPAADATAVSIAQPLAVLFSKRISVSTLNTETVTLLGPNGAVALKPVAVENGDLLFVTPQQQLLPASRYTLFINGATDQNGGALPFSAIGFTTARLNSAAPGGMPAGGAIAAASTQAAGGAAGIDVANNPVKSAAETPVAASVSQQDVAASVARGTSHDQEEWYPDASHFKGDWRTRRYMDRSKLLPPLMAPAGTTALAGQVLTLNGRGLANVILRIGDQMAQTDDTGRFLLLNPDAGAQVLSIDGNSGQQQGCRYGFYQVKIGIKEKQTNVLDYTIWLSKLDPAGTLAIPSPTTQETVLTSPRIPGLELHVPPGTVIRDHEGKIVTELNMTAIPTDRPPFPIPNVGVPVYFTIQPGGAVIQNIDGNKLQGARLVYPNFSGAAPGTRIDFWNYDARGKGWYIYGQGTVTKDGKQVMPDPGVAIYEFTGAMVSDNKNAPPAGAACSNPVKCGDPVDLYTGLFLQDNVDLVVNDVIPLEVHRSYRTRDSTSRAFGIGANLSYDMFIIGDTSPYSYIDLILPDGSRVHYTRVGGPGGYSGSVYTTPNVGSEYDGSTISFAGCTNGNWKLSLKDGSQICFPESTNSTSARKAAAVSFTDRLGNVVNFVRDDFSNLKKIISPNGRSLNFIYDGNNRITQVTDDLGRQLNYQYDDLGRLIKATMPDGTYEAYTYDVNNDMLTVQDQRGNTKVSNQYLPIVAGSSIDRVSQQTFADGKTNTYNYTMVPGNPDAASVVEFTDARGVVSHYEFDQTGRPTSITTAKGLPEQQTVTLERDINGLLLSHTDALGRKTTYAYDESGNLLSTTLLSGTPNAVTTGLTYTPFNLLASISDTLGHQTTLAYDSQNQLAKITDANGNSIRITHNSQGLPTQIVNALGKATVNTYDGGDLVGIVDALNRPLIFSRDAVGRKTSATDGLGNQISYGYDNLNRITQITDALMRPTQFKFDANGNPIQIKDAKGSNHGYTYDVRNYLSNYTDPLQKTENFLYDGNHNLISYTDRNGQTTKYAYDGLNRLIKITYFDGGAITYNYDQGNRITKIADSLNGSISYSYDDLDRITSETNSQGTITYTYYANGLRKTMTASGQPTLSYSYDLGNRLVRIDQAAGSINNNVSQSVNFTYDAANRLTQTTLPNGISINYGYDDAGQLISIVYKKIDGNQIGNLTYTYDVVGRRIGMDGSLARTLLPDNVSAANVDAANRLTTWNGAALIYDDNGNLLDDGVRKYIWNARGQLSEIDDAGGNVVASFGYDALGRRLSKTVNGTSVNYLYDGANVVQAIDNGGRKVNYLTGIGVDTLYAAEIVTGSDAKIAVYLPDGIGSPLQLTDNTGNVLINYSYEAYGATASDASSSFNPFQYTGRENDGTGLYYYRARYYSPSFKRFISQDPMRMAAGGNFYTYTRGNPISYVDPSGNFVWLAPAALGALYGGAMGAASLYRNNPNANGWDYAKAIGLGALGGAIGGATLNPWIMGAASGMAGDLASQYVTMKSNCEEVKLSKFKWKELAAQTALGAATGGLGGWAGAQLLADEEAEAVLAATVAGSASALTNEVLPGEYGGLGPFDSDVIGPVGP